MDEKELIRACKERSIFAQRLLYTRYAPLLRGVCVRYLKNPDDVSDVLQEGFIEIFKCLDQYKGEGSFIGWLKRVMIHSAIDFIRKNKKYRLEDVKEEIDLSEDTFDEAEYLKLLDMPGYEGYMLKALHSLPEILSTVFSMFYVDELSHKEISSLLEIDEITSRTRLNRAKKLLKEYLLNFLKSAQDYARSN
ncbi:MAG: sigma-70 family RNA polymerase sigma factor [Sporocytophaga sp.]|uniref:RNA polymerase sigma factor n=1 Tax=Sporocytophaga sp. TaxID=2231183 RepID=UPI001B088AEC|nr:sigma-70 family RNA polymerase sigma factor [Sporocytophaga sp.]MBO9703560.1 sigma-70 family RNA polymerase sigma factor [Sporocytophaga sp.]